MMVSKDKIQIGNIQIIGLIIAFIAAIAAVCVIPEVRQFCGLDPVDQGESEKTPSSSDDPLGKNPITKSTYIDDSRVDAEKITTKWFHALQNKDIDTLVSLSIPPFFMDNKLLLSISDIRNYYQSTVINNSGLGKVSVDRIMSGSIGEYQTKGLIKRNDRLLNHMQLNEDDIVVVLIVSTERLKGEGIAFYFRQTSKGVEMAGLWD